MKDSLQKVLRYSNTILNFTKFRLDLYFSIIYTVLLIQSGDMIKSGGRWQGM